MKRFSTVEQYWEHYFPRDTAERRDRELRERDPEEWQRQRRQKSIDDLMRRIFK